MDKQNSSNKEIIKTKDVPKTPFKIIYDEEEGYFAVMGKYRVTEIHAKEETIIQLIEEKGWDLLTTVIGIINETINEEK